jgi:hypothetical protein
VIFPARERLLLLSVGALGALKRVLLAVHLLSVNPESGLKLRELPGEDLDLLQPLLRLASSTER